jgi:transposase InsO family protein
MPMRRDDDDQELSRHERWARLRHSILGELLACPPARGELAADLERLASKDWAHPTRRGETKRFSASTIEGWYYAARNAADPMRVLRNKVRKDAGTHPSLSIELRVLLRAQYRAHRSWSYQLHHDNIVVAAEERSLEPPPSYSVLRRYMKESGLVKQPRRNGRNRVREPREMRSYEEEYVHAMWHADFHEGSLRVLTPDGEWKKPELFAAIDDRSRLGCHLQWYLDVSTESFVHGLSQAFQKRGLPRKLMTDNGSAMIAAETRAGLDDLSVAHTPTLAQSPETNAKVESFWGNVEGRLLPMLEGVEELTLELLNDATLAWLEMEYNRRPHEEIATTPLLRFLNERDVGRPCPSSDGLRDAFRQKVWRTQRRSDGTISLVGRRFEVPSAYRHLHRVCIRFARWDLRRVDLYDDREGKVLCRLRPLDKARNADGRRRRLEPLPDALLDAEAAEPVAEIAPLLRKLMADYAATGLPPAYLPKTGRDDDRDDDEENET